MRADVVLEAFARSVHDGTIVIVDHPNDDLLVDGDALRPLSHVLAVAGAQRGMATMRSTLAGLVDSIDAPGGPSATLPTGIGPATPPTLRLDAILDACRRSQTPHIVLLGYAEHLLPPDELHAATGDVGRLIEQLASVAQDPQLTGAGHRIVLFGQTAPLAPLVGALPRMTRVELGLPRLAERRAAIKLMLRSPRHKLRLAPDLHVDRAAQLTGGMTVHAMGVMRMHTSDDVPLTVDAIVAAKRDAIRRLAGDTLVVHDDEVRMSHDVAGVPQVRRWLNEELRRGATSVRAVLCGPPGTGKSRIARAIADALGVASVELGTILGRYVGESEARLRTALDVVAANAPVVLVLDEADETVLGRRGDAANGGEGGQVTANLRAALFAWLGDVGADTGVSVIALSNRPDRLDEASLDRFTVLPVLHPSHREVADIMAIQARRSGRLLDRDGAFEALSGAIETFSGRQAIRLLERSEVHAIESDSQTIKREHVARAAAESMQTLGPEERRQALLAVLSTSWNAHLPWVAARHLGDPTAEPPTFLAPFVLPDGELDTTGLRAHVNELGDIRAR